MAMAMMSDINSLYAIMAMAVYNMYYITAIKT
jgi:hypothetical protein